MARRHGGVQSKAQKARRAGSRPETFEHWRHAGDSAAGKQISRWNAQHFPASLPPPLRSSSGLASPLRGTPPACALWSSPSSRLSRGASTGRAFRTRGFQVKRRRPEEGRAGESSNRGQRALLYVRALALWTIGDAGAGCGRSQHSAVQWQQAQGSTGEGPRRTCAGHRVPHHVSCGGGLVHIKHRLRHLLILHLTAGARGARGQANCALVLWICGRMRSQIVAPPRPGGPTAVNAQWQKAVSLD